MNQFTLKSNSFQFFFPLKDSQKKAEQCFILEIWCIINTKQLYKMNQWAHIWSVTMNK